MYATEIPLIIAKTSWLRCGLVARRFVCALFVFDSACAAEADRTDVFSVGENLDSAFERDDSGHRHETGATFLQTLRESARRTLEVVRRLRFLDRSRDAAGVCAVSALEMKQVAFRIHDRDREFPVVLHSARERFRGDLFGRFFVEFGDFAVGRKSRRSAKEAREEESFKSHRHFSFLDVE